MPRLAVKAMLIFLAIISIIAISLIPVYLLSNLESSLNNTALVAKTVSAESYLPLKSKNLLILIFFYNYHIIVDIKHRVQ